MDHLARNDVDAFGNSYNARVLLESRMAAASYLRSIAGLFPAEDAASIKDAAEHYDKIAESLLLFTCLFAIPGNGQQLRDEVNLRKGIGWLAHARDEESKAIEQLAGINTKWRSDG